MAELLPGTTMYRIAELERVTREQRCQDASPGARSPPTSRRSTGRGTAARTGSTLRRFRYETRAACNMSVARGAS